MASAFTGNKATLSDLGGGTYLDSSTGHYWTGTSFDDATDAGTTRPGGNGGIKTAQADAPGAKGYVGTGNPTGYTGYGEPAPPPAAAAGPTAPSTSAGPDPNQKKSDDLYDFLMGRAHQSSQVDPNDPLIRAQSDNYTANLTRGGRRYLSELAERKGSGGNIGAESRMMAEKNAQAGASHEGELMQHESDQRRQEIEQALTLGSQFLTAQQQMSLQKELASIDNNMKLYQTNLQDKQFNAGLAQSGSQFGMTLANNKDQFGQSLDLSNRTLTQQGDLARAGMSQSGGQFGATMSAREAEFARNLQQRAYEYDTDDAYRRSAYAAK